MYFIIIHLNIAFAIYKASQLMSTLQSIHYAIVLPRTLFYGLHYPSNSSLELRTYSDSNYAEDVNDHIFLQMIFMGKINKTVLNLFNSVINHFLCQFSHKFFYICANSIHPVNFG